MDFLSPALLALGAGAMYGLTALGIVAIHRGSGVLNFAIGGMGLLGAYAYWKLTAAGWPALAAILAGVIVSGASGALVYWAVIKRLRGSSNLTRAVATLSVLIIIQAGLQLLFPETVQGVLVHSALPTGTVKVLGTSVGADRLLLLLIGVVCGFGAWWIYGNTRFGLATTAAADDAEGLATAGWSAERIAAANWTAGGALAGVASIMIVPVTGLLPGDATNLLLAAIAAAVIGGLRSFPLALVGGLLLAIGQSYAIQYVPVQGAGDAVPFIAIVVVLAVAGRALPLRSFVAERLPRVTSGRIRPVPFGIVAAAAFAFLIWGGLSVVWIGAITTTLVLAIVLLSLVVLIGYAGQLSLAQWVIAGLGALAAARLVLAGVPFVLALGLGALVGIPIGIIIGVLASRVRGMSLAILTLALGVAAISTVLTNVSLSGGPSGLAIGAPSILGLDLNPIIYPERYAAFALIALLITIVGVLNLRRGRVGRRFLAMRTNERAATALGINVTETKVVAFVYASMIAAFGGVLTVFRLPVATFSTFDPFTSISYVGFGILGGVGYAAGAVVGGTLPDGGVGSQAVISLLGGTQYSAYVTLISGFLIIYTLIDAPDGVVPTMVARFRALARRRSSPSGGPLATRSHDRTVSGSAHVLEADGVSVVLGGVRAVDDVSFRLAPGEVLGVIGPNGAGKTTLIDALTGFVPLASGDIRLAEHSLRHIPASRRAKLGLGRTFQSLELFEDMTVRENLVVAGDRRDRAAWLTNPVWPDRGSVTELTAELLKELQLEEHLDQYPSELPYGRRRLVSIVRAVAAEPRILLLDEPAAGLDDRDREHLIEAIRRLAGHYGVGVLLIEHDVQLVAAASDQMLALDFGAVVATGDAETVLRAPAVIEAYLGRSHDRPHAEVEVELT